MWGWGPVMAGSAREKAPQYEAMMEWPFQAREEAREAARSAVCASVGDHEVWLAHGEARLVMAGWKWGYGRSSRREGTAGIVFDSSLPIPCAKRLARQELPRC